MAPSKSNPRTISKEKKTLRTTRAIQQTSSLKTKKQIVPIPSSQPEPTSHFTRQHVPKTGLKHPSVPTRPVSKDSACQKGLKRNREGSEGNVTVSLKRRKIFLQEEETSIKDCTLINECDNAVSSHNVTLVEAQTQTQSPFRPHIYTKTHLSAEFVPGLVISTPWHDPDYVVGNARRKDPHRVETAFGPVYSKPRKLIVIAVYEEHCLTIPIFSFNGKGLMFKTNKDEFVAIRDSLIKSTVSLESKYPSLTFKRAKEYRQLTQGFHLMSASSYAHVTFPISLRYSLPCIFEGQLLKSSLHQLINLYNVWAPKFSATKRVGGARAKSTAKQDIPLL